MHGAAKDRRQAARRIVGAIAALAAVAACVLFFWREFDRNWSALKAVRLTLRYPWLAASFAAILASYLVATAAWRFGVNLFASGPRFSFAESVGMVNTTQLTKYVPGKVWGYAMQMALVDRNAFPVSAVLYMNLFLALTNVFIYLLIGGLYFVLASAIVVRGAAIGLEAALLAAYLFFLLFNGKFFALLMRLLRKVLGRSAVFREVPLPAIAKLQAVSAASAILFGAAAALCSLGLGYDLTPSTAYASFSGFLFSDAVGFLAFFVPGGIGVREGLLYLILKEPGAESIALILPIALRLVSMLVDAALGTIGLVYLKKYLRKAAE